MMPQRLNMHCDVTMWILPFSSSTVTSHASIWGWRLHQNGMRYLLSLAFPHSHSYLWLCKKMLFPSVARQRWEASQCVVPGRELEELNKMVVFWGGVCMLLLFCCLCVSTKGATTSSKSYQIWTTNRMNTRMQHLGWSFSSSELIARVKYSLSVW